MKILKTCDELLVWRSSLPAECSLGFVPTMGALHDGHLSLIKKSIQSCDVTLISIFINPRQFGAGEDLDSYPRDLEADLKKISDLDVDAVFMPGVSNIYGDGDSFVVAETKISKKLEGKSRPRFFDGVLTVVSKLFNLTRPHSAFFGKKDAQQLVLVQKMVDSMKYPISVVGCETVRESGGLAMSSRNEYLSDDDRRRAQVIYKSLSNAKVLIDSGEKNPTIIKDTIKTTLLGVSNLTVDYISIVDIDEFIESENKIEPGVEYLISVAVFFKGVRLIDNILVVVQLNRNLTL